MTPTNLQLLLRCAATISIFLAVSQHIYHNELPGLFQIGMAVFLKLCDIQITLERRST